MTKEKGTWMKYNTNKIVLELAVRLNDRRFVTSEHIDAEMYEYTFDSDDALFEQFVEHFVHMAVGRLAADPEQYAYFRSQVFIVHPSDEHDFKRCRDSQPVGFPDMWPRCLDGLILSELPGDSPVPGAGYSVRSDTMLGVCPCRCHLRDGGRRDAWLPRGVGSFKES